MTVCRVVQYIDTAVPELQLIECALLHDKTNFFKSRSWRHFYRPRSKIFISHTPTLGRNCRPGAPDHKGTLASDLKGAGVWAPLPSSPLPLCARHCWWGHQKHFIVNLTRVHFTRVLNFMSHLEYIYILNQDLTKFYKDPPPVGDFSISPQLKLKHAESKREHIVMVKTYIFHRRFSNISHHTNIHLNHLYNYYFVCVVQEGRRPSALYWPAATANNSSNDHSAWFQKQHISASDRLLFNTNEQN